MSDFDPATLYRYLTKGRSPATEVPDKLGPLISALEKAAGSGRKAAAAAGVPESTWRDWRSGRRKPSGLHGAKLDAAREGLRVRVRRQRLTAGRERLLRARPPTVTLKWTFTISRVRETRTRTFPKDSRGRYMPDARWKELWSGVVGDYLTGGDGSKPTATMLEEAIKAYANDEFEYDSVSLDSVEWHYRKLN